MCVCVCVCAEKDALGPQLQSQERVISCKNEEKASGSRKFERKASGKNESSVAVAAKDRYSIILYHTWIADCLQPLLHPQLLYTFRNRACLESHLSYSFTIALSWIALVLYITYPRVCVCVCVFVYAMSSFSGGSHYRQSHRCNYGRWRWTAWALLPSCAKGSLRE